MHNNLLPAYLSSLLNSFQFRFVNKTWNRLRTIIYLLYLCILCCFSYSACVLIGTVISSNVNVPVAEILWKFSVWWYFVFVNSTTRSILHHVHFIGSVQSIQLSVIFVFHALSMKCMSPLLTCTSRCSLVCVSVIFIY